MYFQEMYKTYPFSCSTLPKPWYNQPVQLGLDSADLLDQAKQNKTKQKTTEIPFVTKLAKFQK